MLSPPGAAPHPAVLLVPGRSGFAAFNGIYSYDERAGELQAAGYAVVFVDYLGRFRNCGHVARTQLGGRVCFKWPAGLSGPEDVTIED